MFLESEEGLRRFQSGELPENDQEWHRLVPESARDAVGSQEVQRQSVIFEIFKAERDYVSDLETVKEVFIKGLRDASPPIIPESYLPAFLREVFGNLQEILGHHQRMLAALFARQRDQHPLIQSVADIILDTVLISEFRSEYDVYIKHYPLAESYHRKELKRNRAYQCFLQSLSTDPRTRKRDLITFLSRPVTRLPRLNLVLEQIRKLTDKEHEHPDIETLPIILGVLGDCIKSTQPGIEAAENKVKFWALCESLVFRKGEIIDMDLYDESRTLVYSGPISRRSRTESGWSESWSDETASLVDNYFILTRDETQSNGTVRRRLMSRPIPLFYLRLGSFNDPTEARKERSDDGGLLDSLILDSLRCNTVPVYPFTIYHASGKATRRYTLYVTSESVRKKWYTSLFNAIGLHKVRQEANLWFYPQTLTDGFFRMIGPKVVANSKVRLSGRITSAVPFTSEDRKFIAVGCSTGVYAARRGSEDFRRIFTYSDPSSLAAIQSIGSRIFNKFIIHSDTSLWSYSLDILAQMILGKAEPTMLSASAEKIAGSESNVVFAKYVHIGERALLIYASKKRLQTSTALNVMEAVDKSAPFSHHGSSLSFRPVGEPGYVPRETYDVTPLVRTVGMSTDKGIIIIDPINVAHSTVTVIPDLREAPTNQSKAAAESRAALKSRLDDAKPLGLVRVSPTELLLIYDVLGCYVTKHGIPARSSGYIKWETKATSFAHRGGHVFLFSPQFIEIRNTATGLIVQVIEGTDIRLLYGPPDSDDDTILVAIKGGEDDKDGMSDRIIELVETSEYAATPPFSQPTPRTAVSGIWDEWDM